MVSRKNPFLPTRGTARGAAENRSIDVQECESVLALAQKISNRLDGWWNAREMMNGGGGGGGAAKILSSLNDSC